MKRKLEGLERDPTQIQGKSSDNESSILQHFHLTTVGSSLASDFSQAFELWEFNLGDELINTTLTEPAQGVVHNEQNHHYFYLICQGRVRLLSFDAEKQRDVSVLVLEEGGTFGGDYLFNSTFLAYRAIAASSGLMARISITQLQYWFNQLPQLECKLREQAQHRQALIFFKTLTELRRTSSLTLQQLLPYFTEEQVAAGESLVDFTPTDSGRFWLGSGQIQTTGESIRLPVIGESWGYPHPVPADWVAQTDLFIYKLPREQWEAAQIIAPSLATTFPESADNHHNTALQNGHRTSSGNPSLVHPTRTSAQPRSRLSSKRLQSQVDKLSKDAQFNSEAFPQDNSTNIDFPQPTNRWSQRRGFWRGYPFIQQQSSSDCGAACLAMIGRYWGKQWTVNTLRNLLGVGRSGASLKSLAKASDTLGFWASPVRASLNRLVERKQPWIAHWQGDHYVVVYRVRGDRILIADPALGKRSLSRAEFTASWTGYALLLEPTERLKATPNESTSLGSFLGAIWPYRSLVGQIILASLLIQLFGLITPLFTQVILDRVVVNKSFITLHVFSLGLLLFGIWRIGLTAMRQYLLDYFANRLDLTLVSGFISHTLTLPLKFFESRSVGDIITRVQENQKLQRFLTRQAVTAWLDALMVFVYLGLMAYYNWHLTLLVLALIPPIVILTVVASPFLRGVSRQIFTEEAGQNSSLVEMMTGIATIKAAAAERELRWRWEDRLTSTLNARFRGQKLANTLQSTSGLIHTLGSTALLWYGATLVIQNQLTIGQFVAFNMLIGNVINPVLALVALWDELQEVMVSVERLNDVFSATPEESPQKPLMVLPQIRGDVAFENVTFRYGQEEERNTLGNITFEVNSGQTIAIVGRSGSGKSTLVNLLQGLHHPTSGRILIDGHDIRHVSPSSLRSQMGVVPQECFLFSGTILENITLHSDDFTLEQAIEVAKLAEAHHFIQDLPLGYNTKVGERGTNLSGGQRQRIAIARALLKNPRILILDEATSSLDTESERRFQQNLARISRDRTTLIVAHRLSTVRHADRILVLERGILAEQGTHDELIALQGLYYHLAQQQLDL